MKRIGLLVLLLASPAQAQFYPGAVPPAGSVTPAMLAADTPGDNECLTYDLATLSFIWDSCGGGGSTPTGTGYRHVTAGVEDAAADLVTLTAASDVAPNQGTTTTVLHGNAAGQASFAAVADADLSSNYSGVGACAAAAAVTATVDNAAPTCSANVMFDNEANTVTQNLTLNDGSGGSPTLSFVDNGAPVTYTISAFAGDLSITLSSGSDQGIQITNVGAGVTELSIDGASFSTNHPGGAVDDQVLLAASATVSAWKSVPDCDDSGGNHLNYDTGTNAFTCGTTGPSGSGLTHPQVMTRLAVGGAY